MELPPFDPDTGLLPSGVHACSWEQIVDRFGWNRRRRELLDGLAEALELLRAAGCQRVWLNGSFVTTKEEPGDFDAVWDYTGVDVDALDPVFFDFSNNRQAQRSRFGGDLFPNLIQTRSGLNFAEFFQQERDGTTKGIVLIDLTRSDQP